MDLAALSIFCTVVRENGITRAAAKLHRVQSNVTTRIKQLEGALGTQLFFREGRKLVLTPAGHTLLDYAERLLALADEARDALANERPHGRLRLGAMESTAATRLPQRLAEYHNQWPDVTLELATGTTGCLINRLRAFDIDVALIATPVEGLSHLTDMFELTPVYREELVLIAARDHPPIRQPRDVGVATLVAFEPGCAYRAYAERWYAHDALRPHRVLELGSYHAIVACVAAGAGIAVAPRSVLELQRASGHEMGLSMHPLPDIGTIDTLLAWRRGYASSAARALRQILLADLAVAVAPPHAATATATATPSRPPPSRRRQPPAAPIASAGRAA
ncbi:LysR family transcriptional regulator [Mycetohabitans sp. B8]|uniref:LysR substrate-binding domain-containing protein n=1 Tax=Mycetohabitans sp. B8 TaxID=2841845 RepID=UPI001F21E864|nr:LysR substrate-binding domain-containing protein [Mycetohabitans sp. B8]MCG1041801.1 LysR family transcriptional regulator [Mycetohabitans sp. B8]